MMRRSSAPPSHNCRRVAGLALALALVAGTAEPPLAVGQSPPAIRSATPVGNASVAGGQAAGGMGGAFNVIQRPEGMQFVGPVTAQGRLVYSPRSGMQLKLQAGETGQYGYWPLEATVSVAKAPLNDRQIRISFHMGDWSNANAAMTVNQSFTLKKNTKSAQATLLLPRYQHAPMCGWKVWMDGRWDDELSADHINIPQQQINVGVAALVASANQAPWELQASLQVFGNGSYSVKGAGPRELPVDWKHYSTVDLVIVPADEFAALIDGFPRQATALLRWLHAGGNVWLIDVASDWRELTEVERALGLDEGDAADAEEANDADAAIVARGWRFVPLNERALEPTEGALELSGYDLIEDQQPQRNSRDRRDSPDPSTRAVFDLTSREWFAVRAHGMGAVTAFRADLRDPKGPGTGWQGPLGLDPTAVVGMEFGNSSSLEASPDQPVDPAMQGQLTEVQELRNAVQRSLLLPRLNWTMRHGNKPDEGNPEFNNWLIPGVGVAPVGQFQLLISLFVLGIGPLNYWWLKRRKKLPMLLATVPAAATLVTLLLLVFGVLADGLGAQVRARSFTLLDQRSGEAACWSRLSYYAGLSPRRGLTLPTDVVVYPIMSSWAEQRSWRRNTVKRTMSWEDHQRLTGGWVASRTPTQYLAVAARPSQKRLELRATDDGLRVVNHLGVTVTHLVVQAHDGRAYWCEDLAPDAGRVLPVADAGEITGKLRRLFLDHFPEYPPGAESLNFGGGYYGPALSNNLMEAQLEAINAPVVNAWENGGYIAVTDRGVELDVGLDDADEESSFHVIRGKW